MSADRTPRLERKLIYWSVQVFIILYLTVAAIIIYKETLDFNADTQFYSAIISEEVRADFLTNIRDFESYVASRVADFQLSAVGAGSDGVVASFALQSPARLELLVMSQVARTEVKVTRYDATGHALSPASQIEPADLALAQTLRHRFFDGDLNDGWGAPLLVSASQWRLPYAVQLDDLRLLIMLAPLEFFFTDASICYEQGELQRLLATAPDPASADDVSTPRLAAVRGIYTDPASASGASIMHCLNIIEKDVTETLQQVKWYNLLSLPDFIRIYYHTVVPGLVLGIEYDTADLYNELQTYLLWVMLLLLCVFGLIILVIRRMARKILHSLINLLTAAREISEGHLEARLPERQDYLELAQFSRLVNNLIERLQVQVDRLHQETMKSAALDNELAIAGQIQQELVTHYDLEELNNRFTCDIGTFLAPAKQVAGDFYCLAPRPDGKLLFAIGDVSGKGIAAAIVARDCVNLLMANGKRLGLADLLQVTNATLYERFASQSMFATLYCCLLDPKRGLLEHADAGHETPLLYQKRDATIGRLPVARNIALGFLPDAIYETSAQRLAADHCLLLYSDGLDGGLEQIRAARGLPLGVTLLTNAALKNVEMQTLLQCVYKQALALQDNRAYDDITMVGVSMEKRGYKSFHLSPGPEAAGAAIVRLRELCAARALSAECSNRLCVILDEWVSNLVHYAEVDSDIIVSWLSAEAEVVLEIVARCNNILNPLEQSDLDVEARLQSAAVGGFGLHIIRNLAGTLAFDVTERWTRLEARVQP
ncbi:MAG: SpoIIE family protein phosphatase [Gammaproteobacteria bacterium]|nr:SpoIIE family protein phosphatase [Gammaproteobacteria bacterium]